MRGRGADQTELTSQPLLGKNTPVSVHEGIRRSEGISVTLEVPHGNVCCCWVHKARYDEMICVHGLAPSACGWLSLPAIDITELKVEVDGRENGIGTKKAMTRYSIAKPIPQRNTNDQITSTPWRSEVDSSGMGTICHDLTRGRARVQGV